MLMFSIEYCKLPYSHDILRLFTRNSRALIFWFSCEENSTFTGQWSSLYRINNTYSSVKKLWDFRCFFLQTLLQYMIYYIM